jgi:hypothetical protein
MLCQLTYLTEFGLSVISPIVLSVLVGVWLNRRFDIGEWIIVLLLGVGLISGGCSFYRFVRIFLNMEKKSPPRGGEGEWENED